MGALYNNFFIGDSVLKDAVAATKITFVTEQFSHFMLHTSSFFANLTKIQPILLAPAPGGSVVKRLHIIAYRIGFGLGA